MHQRSSTSILKPVVITKANNKQKGSDREERKKSDQRSPSSTKSSDFDAGAIIDQLNLLQIIRENN